MVAEPEGDERQPAAVAVSPPRLSQQPDAAAQQFFGEG